MASILNEAKAKATVAKDSGEERGRDEVPTRQSLLFRGI